MTDFVALLRAVNVGGRILPMADLRAIAGSLGFEAVRTYIASGNLLLRSHLSEAEVKRMLETALEQAMGQSVPVFVRSAGDIAKIAADRPFADLAANRVGILFLDSPPAADVAATARHRADDERIALGRREIYVGYGAAGMGRSRLVLPAMREGTMRNLNTVIKLAGMERQ